MLGTEDPYVCGWKVEKMLFWGDFGTRLKICHIPIHQVKLKQCNLYSDMLNFTTRGFIYLKKKKFLRIQFF